MPEACCRHVGSWWWRKVRSTCGRTREWLFLSSWTWCLFSLSLFNAFSRFRLQSDFLFALTRGIFPGTRGKSFEKHASQQVQPAQVYSPPIYRSHWLPYSLSHLLLPVNVAQVIVLQWWPKKKKSKKAKKKKKREKYKENEKGGKMGRGRSAGI